MLDLPFFVIFGDFLLVVIKARGKTMFGIFVHFVSTNLKFHHAFVFRDDGSVNTLVAILLWHSNVIFDATTHGHVKRMNDAKRKITIRDIIYDDAKRGEVINFTDILIVFGEFAMKRINRFDASREFKMNFFFGEGGRNFLFDFP